MASAMASSLRGDGDDDGDGNAADACGEQRLATQRDRGATLVIGARVVIVSPERRVSLPPDELAAHFDAWLPLWLREGGGLSELCAVKWMPPDAKTAVGDGGSVLAAAPLDPQLSAGAVERELHCLVAMDNDRGIAVLPESALEVAVSCGTPFLLRPLDVGVMAPWRRGAADAFAAVADLLSPITVVAGEPADMAAIRSESEGSPTADAPAASPPPVVVVTVACRKHPYFDTEFVWLVRRVASPTSARAVDNGSTDAASVVLTVAHGAELLRLPRRCPRRVSAEAGVNPLAGSSCAATDVTALPSDPTPSDTICEVVVESRASANAGAVPLNADPAAPLRRKREHEEADGGTHLEYQPVGFGSEAFLRRVAHPGLRGNEEALRAALHLVVAEAAAAAHTDLLSEPVVQRADHGCTF